LSTTADRLPSSGTVASSATEQVLALLAEALGVALCDVEAEGVFVGFATEDPNEDAAMSKISASKPLPEPIATCLK